MITLVLSDAHLQASFGHFEYAARFRYRFFCCESEDMYSCFRMLTDAPEPEIVALIEQARLASSQWISLRSHDDQMERYKMRRDRPAANPASQLPDDVFEVYSRADNRCCAAEARLEKVLKNLGGEEDFCEVGPVRRGTPRLGDAKYVYRRGTLWSSRRELTREQWIALIDRGITKDKILLDSLTADLSSDRAGAGSRSISVEVRREVWRRDEGKCVVCQSQVRLEFDHIIPVTMGGNNTARNVQLLCETHNRLKGGSLG